MFTDRIFRIPRIWSNNELKKFSSLFTGDIVNVSAWKDEDKQGGYYKNYFCNAKTYSITNFETDARGYQGHENEIFLNLENKLPENLQNKFDVVFNHTTLEHIFDVNTAFKNLCLMSNDVVILVVPFLQQMHAAYGDYWRFTPLAIKKLFEKNGLSIVYSSFNEDRNSSVYLFFIASKRPSNWSEIQNTFSYKISKRKFFSDSEEYVGQRSINNNFLVTVIKKLKGKFR